MGGMTPASFFARLTSFVDLGDSATCRYIRSHLSTSHPHFSECAVHPHFEMLPAQEPFSTFLIANTPFNCLLACFMDPCEPLSLCRGLMDFVSDSVWQLGQ